MAGQGKIPRRHKMVGWFDIRQLIPTGIRTAISTVFGEFADRREAMAAARHVNPGKIECAYDYRAKADRNREFWFDFVADTGDGWNPTYAIARLLTDPALTVPGMPECRGVPPVLIMGGDQVYPAAGRNEYSERLVAPFAAAWQAKPRPAGEATPDVYAIPGNHDWYDGLSSFLAIFCRRRGAGSWNTSEAGRVFAGRQTQQTRSYFALALPGDWWVWGVDVQLGGYIDQPQIDYFLHVATNWMQPDSRLIICTGNPEWAYLDASDLKGRFRNFDYVVSLARREGHKHRVCAVLTGDSHHYARYVEDGCHYLTAGGGGAFLHPTHTLRRAIPFSWDYPSPGAPPGAAGPPYHRKFVLAKDRKTGLESLYPSRSQSRWLALGNLAFPFLNWTFAGVMAAMWASFAWLLSFNADNTLAAMLRGGTVDNAVAGYLRLIVASPLPVILLLVAAGGFYYFADYKPTWLRLVAGALHALVHFVAGTLLAIVLARHLDGQGGDALLVALVFAGGWLLSGLVFGLYLLISVLLFNAHSNEAFSALRIQGYKNFLRLRIDGSGRLTIFPIGLRSVPRDRGKSLKNPPLQPHLIEEPISIA